MDRYHVQMFRRVKTVYLGGPQYKSDLLPHLAKFHDMRELELYGTSVSDGELEVWRQQHPRVAVKVTRNDLIYVNNSLIGR